MSIEQHTPRDGERSDIEICIRGAREKWQKLGFCLNWLKEKPHLVAYYRLKFKLIMIMKMIITNEYGDENGQKPDQ